MMGRVVYWCGPSPDKCQISNKPITDTFIDGATTLGGWAIMHPDAYVQHGRGLGTGLGQRYERQPDGRWLKVEG